MTEAVSPDGGPERALSKSYPAVPAACGAVRADIAAFLSTNDVDGETIDIALLAASELATNGLVHRKVRDGELFSVTVRVASEPGGVWIYLTVVDGGPGRLRMPGGIVDGAEHGRGLMLLRGLGIVVYGAPAAHAPGYEVSALFPADAALRTRLREYGCSPSMPGPLAQCLRPVPAPAQSRVISGADAVTPRPVRDPYRTMPPSHRAISSNATTTRHTSE